MFDRMIAGFFESIGWSVLGFINYLGNVALLAGSSFRSLFTQRWRWRETLYQIYSIGAKSLPVVLLTGAFMGMVFAAQTYFQFHKVQMDTSTGPAVAIALSRELGPIISSLMVAGRVGAAMAAEIGTMRVTDQIDALTTLSTNPYRYLVAPRLIAGLTMLPILVLVADIIGVFGGFLVSTYKLQFNAASYVQRSVDFLQTQDVVAGLAKAAVFGFIVTLMGCYNGYHSKGGAQGVGAATTYAVVSSSILILVFDYVLTAAFFGR